MLSRIRQLYPDATTICATLMRTCVRGDTDWKLPEQYAGIPFEEYNNAIRRSCKRKNILLADLADTGLRYETLDGSHPTADGHLTLSVACIGFLKDYIKIKPRRNNDTMIKSYAYTDRGGREVNEDSYIVLDDKDYKCYVLCDGLGGHGKGEVASALVTDIFREYYEEGIDKPEEFIGNVLNVAQTMLLSEQISQNARDKMKTTATAVLVADGVVYRGYIGDSRIYVFNKNKVRERSIDHSVPQMLVAAREIKEKEIRNHPDRNKLLKVMGIEWEKSEFQIMEALDENDCQAILLCSDGFWELITEKDMCSLLKKSTSVKDWIERMTAMVKENGADKNMDNNTAIGIWFG